MMTETGPIMISLSADINVAYYKVMTFLAPDTYSLPSNIVNTEVSDVKWNPGVMKEKNNRYKLNNNYPNPFNPSTTIAYEISKRGYTTLEVYNALGQKVSTLVKEVKESGRYQVQ